MLKTKLTADELEIIAETSRKAALAQVASLGSTKKLAPEVKVAFLRDLDNSVTNAEYALNAKEKTKIARALTQFKDDNDVEVVKLLKLIHSRLTKITKVTGRLNRSDTAAFMSSEKDSLSFVMLNKDFFYRHDGMSFGAIKDGEANLTREFFGGEAGVTGGRGFKIQGQYIDEEDRKKRGSMPEEEYKLQIEDKYISEITENKQLQHWIKHNGHMAGPAGQCWANIEKLFHDKFGMRFRMDQDPARGLNHTSFHVNNPNNEPNAVYFVANIPFKDATLHIGDDIDVIPGRTREINLATLCHKHVPDAEVRLKHLKLQSDAIDPVAVFEIKIRAEATDKGVVAKIETETFNCFHRNLLPAFIQIGRYVEERRNFSHIVGDIKELTKRHHIDSGPAMAFFSRPEGWDIGQVILKDIERMEKQIATNPTEFNYDLNSRNLLNKLAELKLKHLSSPETEGGNKLLDALDELISNRANDYKDNAYVDAKRYFEFLANNIDDQINRLERFIKQEKGIFLPNENTSSIVTNFKSKLDQMRKEARTNTTIRKYDDGAKNLLSSLAQLREEHKGKPQNLADKLFIDVAEAIVQQHTRSYKGGLEFKPEVAVPAAALGK